MIRDQEEHGGNQNAHGFLALPVDGVAPAPMGKLQNIAGKGREQQACRGWQEAHTELVKRVQEDLGRAASMSVVVFLLHSLCLLFSVSLKSSSLCCLRATGPDVAAPDSASYYSHVSAWKRLIVSATLGHLPRRKNLLAWFKPGFSTPIQLTEGIEPRMVHRSITKVQGFSLCMCV